MDHLHHFRLAADPFRNEPLMRLVIETPPHRDASLRLERGVRQSKGISLLIGETGAGKTMLVRRLLDGLEEEIFEASMLVVLNASADASWLLTRYAAQLGVEEPAAEPEELLRQVYESLAIIREDGRHAVLILDDAESLASAPALAAIASLSKLEYEERRLLSIVLAGTPQLERALSRHPQLAHRVDVKVRLAPLDLAGSAEYLARRIEQAEGDRAILEEDAVEALHRLGHGLPGVMNTLADNALFEAFLCARQRVTRVDVERAHRDLCWEAAYQTSLEAPTSQRRTARAGSPAALERAPAIAAAELAGLDSELEAAFDAATSGHAERPPHGRAETDPGETFESVADFLPSEGPPKHDDAELEDLLIELVDD